MWFKTLLISIFLLMCAFCETTENQGFITLVTKPFVYFNKTFNAHLATSELPQATQILVSFRNEQYPFSMSISKASSVNQFIKFEAIDETAPENVDDPNAVSVIPLTLNVHRNGKCLLKKVNIIDASKKNHVFIQLDKPIYKAGDKIQYRVIAMDDETKPVSIINIYVRIEDYAGQILYNQTKFTIDPNGKEKFGLFNDTFEIEKEVNAGEWKISAKINDFSNAEKIFHVEEYEMSLFKIKVDHPEVVYFNNENKEGEISIKFSGKYSFGINANGFAKLTITNSNSNIVYKDHGIKVNSEVIKTISLKDLQIEMLQKAQSYKIDIEFTDDATQLVQSASSYFTVENKKEYEIELINPPKLVPGMPYEIYLSVRDKNGKKIKKEYEPVWLQAKLYEGQNKEQGQSFNNLKYFTIMFRIETTIQTTKLEMEFEYLSVKKKFTPELKDDTSCELRVMVKDKKMEIGKNVNVEIYGSQALGVGSVLVFGKFGIEAAVRFDCGLDMSCQVSFDAKAEMKPEAKIVVYKVNKFTDKVCVGSKIITFDEFSDNNVTLKLSSPKAEYGKAFNYDVITTKESFVAVLAIDKSITFNRDTNHDITTTDVIKELISPVNSYRLDIQDEEVFYDKMHDNYVINLNLDNWVGCTDEELKLFKNVSEIYGHVSNSISSTAREPEKHKFISIPSSSNTTVDKIRRNFPETWIWDIHHFNKNQNNQTFTALVPDTMTTWLFTAFSVNKDYGFALAEPQELEVSKDFFMKLNVPFTLRLGEVLKLEIIIFNYLKQSNLPKVTLTIFAKPESEKEVQFKLAKASGAQGFCNTTFSNEIEHREEIVTNYNEGTRFDSVYIEPLRNGPMKIKAKIETKIGDVLHEDIVEKVIEVKNEGVGHFFSQTIEFHHDEHEHNEEKIHFIIQDKTIGSIEITAEIASRIEGPRINFESIDYITTDKFGETSCSKFARTLYLLDYATKIGETTSKIRTKAKGILTESYNDLMGFKKDDGGFDTFNVQDPTSIGSTWMSAYVAKVLQHAVQMEEQNQPKNIELIKQYKKIIKKALNYCTQDQNDDGSFKEIGYAKIPTAPLEKKSSRKGRFTCFVLIALLKNEWLKNSHKEKIQKAFGYISQITYGDNYFAAVCAYALALNEGDTDLLLRQLENSAELEGGSMYWDLQNGVDTAPNTRALIGSYVALTYLKLNKTENSKPILKWLIKHRNVNGNFEDTHSTAMAYEVFATMSKYITKSNTNMVIKFMNQNGMNHSEHKVTSETSSGLFPVSTLPKNSTMIRVSAEGVGYVRILVNFQYYINVDKTFDIFILSVKPRDYKKSSEIKIIEITAKKKTEAVKNDLITVQLFLPSGYIYMTDKTDAKNNVSPRGAIKTVETKNAETFVEFILKDLEEEVRLNVYIREFYEVKKLKKGYVKIFNKGNPSETFTTKFIDLETSSCL